MFLIYNSVVRYQGVGDCREVSDKKNIPVCYRKIQHVRVFIQTALRREKTFTYTKILFYTFIFL